MRNSVYEAPSLEGWVHTYSGKVRDLYVPRDGSVGGGLDVVLVVASDRISAYDSIMPTPIPDKGKILTGMTLWWLEQLSSLVPNHLVSLEVPEEVRGRAMICRQLRMFPVECVVRGYLTGSGLHSYRETGQICGNVLPQNLDEGYRLERPIFTPAAKAQYGAHDENITYQRMAGIVGADMAHELRKASVALYSKASEIAAVRGLIIADTKFEFGTCSDTGIGQIVLGDEVLTPDSSRYWSADQWQPGVEQASFDKQYLRDWLPRSGWDPRGKQPPPPLPDSVVEATRSRYIEAYERLTGKAFQA